MSESNRGPSYAEGRYRLQIIGADLGESKDGTPQIEVAVKILGEYHDGSLEHLSGPSRTVYMALTEGTLGTTANPGWVLLTLRDLGFKGPTFADLGPLVGQERDGQCTHDDYTGTIREKWSIWREGPRQPKNPAKPDTVRMLSAKYRDLLKSVSGGPTAPQQPKNPPANGKLHQPRGNPTPPPPPPPPPEEPTEENSENSSVDIPF